MKYAMVLLGALALTSAGCEDKCDTGDPCSKSCGPCEVALCVAKGICSCKPLSPAECNGGGGDGGPIGDGGGLPTNEAGMPVQCADPQGKLVLNEVLPDGEPTEDGEFVEVVNISDDPVNLAGVRITSLRGESQVDRVIFTGGCLPASGAVAAFPNEADWVWIPTPSPRPTYELKSFGFSNSADIDFRLVDSGGTVISQMAGSADLVDPGVSVNRNPDLGDEGLVQHTAFPGGVPASPGRCPNLGTYAADCADGPGPGGPDGGPPPGDGGPPPTDGGPPPGDGGPNPRLDMGPPADMGPALPCDPPAAGDLIVNEVLVDAATPEGDNEFVELVNLTDRALAMEGVQVLVNSSGSEQPTEVRYTFHGGCLPARGALAAYANDRGEVAPEAEFPIRVDASSTLANSRALFGALRLGDTVLDTFEVPQALIDEGVSANRDPDRSGATFSQHTTLNADLMSSPGRCANGGLHHEGCPAP